MTARERIGIFGGTFDPVHIGHLVAAQNARHQAGLDRVLMMVAGHPWQKQQSRLITDAELRFAAVARAVDGCAGLEASRLELDRTGPSYTAETLRELEGLFPAAELFLILGTDAAAKLMTWKAHEEVAARAQVVVVDRAGVSQEEPLDLPAPWRVQRVAMPGLNISSTDLRERIADGRPLDFLIPEAAMEIVVSGWGYNRS